MIALRKKLRMSQSVFAAALNVSTKFVQSWERVRMPCRGELRLIEILTGQPELVSSLILNGAPPRPGRTPKARKRTPRALVASGSLLLRYSAPAIGRTENRPPQGGC